jgi:hypothetical protein
MAWEAPGSPLRTAFFIRETQSPSLIFHNSGGTTRNAGIDVRADDTLQAFEAMSYFPDKLNAAGPRSA